MSDSFLVAAAVRAADASVPSVKSQLEAAFGVSSSSSCLVLATLLSDLSAERLTMQDFAREARAAGMPIPEIAAALKRFAAAKEAASAASADSADEQTILPAGHYFGRTHGTAVKVVDGIFVPAEAAPTPAAAAAGPDSTAASLAWLSERGSWGCRAAERLGPDNDFLPHLDLRDTSRGGRVAGGKLGAEVALHLARALSQNGVLTSLDLADNEVCAPGAEHIAWALTTNRTLIDLNLSGNGLGDAGARSFAPMLLANTVLLALDLRDNGITGPVAEELRAAWGSRPQAALQVQ